MLFQSFEGIRIGATISARQQRKSFFLFHFEALDWLAHRGPSEVFFFVLFSGPLVSPPVCAISIETEKYGGGGSGGGGERV